MHSLDPLTAEEFRQVAAVLKHERGVDERWRLASIELREPVGERGYFYSPTVVSGLRQDDEMVQSEIFGPVITVQRFTDEDEALRWDLSRATTVTL
jgi:acyl-CoA reductase-like NAD-dependent aldehyde dehydrogenase